MILNLKDLVGAPVRGADGEIGRVENFYFDDFEWAVRYLVVDARHWLEGRTVLISPTAIGHPLAADGAMHLTLTREMVAESPALAAGQPVSRQYETELHNYYQWPFYWSTTGTTTGMGPADMPAAPLTGIGEAAPANVERAGRSIEPQMDPHLRSFEEVTGYRLDARDGDIGQVDDFLVQDGDWNILYLVVDTGGLLSSHEVLISPNWIEDVRWPDGRVQIDLKTETIQNSPPYDPDVELTPEYLRNLHRHYGKD